MSVLELSLTTCGQDRDVDEACRDCVHRRLGDVPGVRQVSIDQNGPRLDVRVDYDSDQIDEQTLKLRAGVDLPAHLTVMSGRGRASVWPWALSQPELLLVLAGGLALAAGASVYWLGGPDWLRFALLGASALATSTRTGPGAIEALKRLDLDVDVLMFVAAGGAAVLGHPEEGAFLLFLFGLGAAGEHLALARARKNINALAEIAPETARLLDEAGNEQRVAVEQLAVGDRVRVRPYDRLPIDGVVIEGQSIVNQAPITGESVPVPKHADDEVFAGTLNGDGQLVVAVTRPAGESTLARIVQLVEQAQASQSPTQRFTERIERWYVPAVFAATMLLIVLPPLFGVVPRINPARMWGGWFYQAMAFLTAASPCALAIGTPAAVLCGIARSARIGVLIKGGAYLELLGEVDAVAFDKTGTLTTGRPEVTDVLPAEGVDAEALLCCAASVESRVTHPLAQAITNRARQRDCRFCQADEVRQAAGFGVVGMVNGREVSVGKADEQADPRVTELRAAGKTVVRVERDGRTMGLIALADQPRPAAAAVLARLRAIGVGHTTMLTGDHASVARAIGDQLGLDSVTADLLPEQKLEAIDRLRREHGQVAMVGDGVNDAPALAEADVGIAMGAAGADVAMDSADVVLMGDDLRRLPEAIELSQHARRIIGQNLAIALGVIAIVSPLAALGFANLALAVVLHEGSTVVVVLNSLRLLRGRRREDDEAAAEAHPDWQNCPLPEPGDDRCQLVLGPTVSV